MACLMLLLCGIYHWTPHRLEALADILLFSLASVTAVTGLFLPFIAGAHLIRKHKRHRRRVRRLVLLSTVAFLVDGAIGLVFLEIATRIFAGLG